MSNPTWDDLSKTGERVPQRSAEQQRYDDLCASIFSVGAGAELMQMIRARTIEARSPRLAPDAVIREDEAVRRFVASLERARDRGNETSAKGVKPA